MISTAPTYAHKHSHYSMIMFAMMDLQIKSSINWGGIGCFKVQLSELGTTSFNEPKGAPTRTIFQNERGEFRIVQEYLKSQV